MAAFKSREETPKEGICGRSMPHRNNIESATLPCKHFLRPLTRSADFRAWTVVAADAACKMDKAL